MICVQLQLRILSEARKHLSGTQSWNLLSVSVADTLTCIYFSEYHNCGRLSVSLSLCLFSNRFDSLSSFSEQFVDSNWKLGNLCTL